MRWLLIVFLVSLGALLFAAAGVARHIWLHHGRRSDTRGKPAAELKPAKEPELKP